MSAKELLKTLEKGRSLKEQIKKIDEKIFKLEREKHHLETKRLKLTSELREKGFNVKGD